MKNRKKGRIIRYLLLATGAVVFTLPMIYMISTSLRPNGALYEYPPRFFPKWEALTLENYRYILNQSKFYLNFLNSAVVSLSTVTLAAAVSSAINRLMLPTCDGLVATEKITLPVTPAARLSRIISAAVPLYLIGRL